MSIIYLCIIYSAYAVSKWRIIVKQYFLLAALFAAPGAAVFTMGVVPLTSMYASV